MAALPRLSDCSIATLGPGFEKEAIVYNVLLLVEQLASERMDNELLQSTRILGALLIFFGDFFWLFGRQPLTKITRGIIPEHGDQERRPQGGSANVGAAYVPVVQDLGAFYRNNLVRAYRSNKGSTPEPASHPSRPSFDSLKAMNDEYLKGSGTSYEAAKKMALAREGFKCILTGNYDLSSCLKNDELRRRARADSPGGLAPTECCHLFLPATVQTLSRATDSDGDKRHYASAVLAVMSSFGLEQLAKEIASKDGVHDLSNIMIMRTELHNLFDRLQIWLEPTPTANEYTICGPVDILSTYNLHRGRTVKFRDCSGSGSPLALPDRRLLALHAACARVVHMSGTAEYFERWEDYHDRPPFLLPDGSSADILAQRLNHELMISS